MAEKKDKGELFVCEHCDQEFIADRSFDDAAEEYKRDFGKTLEMHEVVLVCGDCYQKLIQFHTNRRDKA